MSGDTWIVRTWLGGAGGIGRYRPMMLLNSWKGTKKHQHPPLRKMIGSAVSVLLRCRNLGLAEFWGLVSPASVEGVGLEVTQHCRMEVKPEKVMWEALFLQLWEKLGFYSQTHVFLHTEMFVQCS